MTTPSLEERMARIEGAFEQIGLRLGRIESHFDQMNDRMDRLETRMDQLMYWQLGLLAAIAAAILATVLTRLF